VFLVLAYMLSQFYRACLAVLSPVLAQDIGATPEDLARASGLWFFAFALAQIPVGWALDRVGPRLTAALPLGLCAGGGALVFATAQGPGAVSGAMVLIGIGCAPVMVAAYYIFARSFPPALFGTLAGATLGFGSLGNIASSLPLAWAMTAFGWRATLAAAAGITLAVAVALARFIRDPERVPGHATRGALIDLLRDRRLWLVAPMMVAGYAPAADVNGLWVGPYMAGVYGLNTAGIGRTSLLMGVAMAAGSFVYGSLDRIVGSRKWGVFGGNLLALAALVALGLAPEAGRWTSALLLAALGFAGAAYPAVMAHGRLFLPQHLVGRGMALLTMVGIGGTGLMQGITGRIHAAIGDVPPTAPFAAIFLFFAALLAAALALYAFSADRAD
jgi:nitrate/nitrite transporter NarK